MNCRTARSYSSLGLSQFVWTFDSRSAFRMYVATRSWTAVTSPSNGQTPTSVWYRKYSSLRSGAGAPSTSILNRRFNARHLIMAAFHAPGISDRTLIRARTSSPRFVSCVHVADNAAGHRRWRSTIQAWTDAGATPNRVGSDPTSLRDTSRL